MFGRPRPRPRPSPLPPLSPLPDPSPLPPIVIPSDPIKIASDVNPLGMSYWRNINYHFGRENLLIALAIHDQLRVLTIRKSDLVVVDDRSLGVHHTGEGIFFSATRHDILFVPLDNSLIIVNVFTGDRSTIWQSPNKLWQMHANYNEDVFSATIKNDDYHPIAWGVYKNNQEILYPLYNIPDECQIDKSGNWLLIKETEGDNEYNRIIDINSQSEVKIDDPAGAVGHSDCGFNCTMGENNYSSKGGALDLITFGDMSQKNIYSTGVWNMGYVSFQNANPNIPLEQSWCLLTTPTDIFLVKCDGSGEAKHVCPNLTQNQEYEHRSKANICPLGEYAVWSAFVDGSLNIYLARIP